MALLKLQHIDKSFKSKQVLKDISFELAKGEIMGLIGENGSGKTTILKVVLGLVNKTYGDVIINDKKVVQGDYSYLKNIGAIIEYPTFYERLTAKRYLFLISALYDKDFNDKSVDDCLSLVGLINNFNNSSLDKSLKFFAYPKP